MTEEQPIRYRIEEWSAAANNTRQMSRWTALAMGSLGATIFAGGPLTFGVDDNLSPVRFVSAGVLFVAASWCALRVIWIASVLQLRQPYSPLAPPGQPSARRRRLAEHDPTTDQYLAVRKCRGEEEKALAKAEARLESVKADLRQRTAGVTLAEGQQEKATAITCLALTKIRLEEASDELEAQQRKVEQLSHKAELVMGRGSLLFVNREFTAHMRRALICAGAVPVLGVAFVSLLVPQSPESTRPSAGLVLPRTSAVANEWRDLGLESPSCRNPAGALVVVVEGGSGTVEEPWIVSTSKPGSEGCPTMTLELTRAEARLARLDPPGAR